MTYFRSIVYSPDGKYIACGCTRGYISVLDFESGQSIHCFEGHGDSVRSLCFSADSKYLLSGSADKTVKMHSVRDGTVLNIMTDHTSDVQSVHFSPDCRTFISGSQDKTIKVWDVTNLNCLATIKHKDHVNGVKFNSTGDKILSVTQGGSINIYSRL